MKRLGLQHNYHDAQLQRVRFEERRIVFETSLDGHWNKDCPQKAQLIFETVHNLEEIKTLFGAVGRQSLVDVADEIIGVAKLSKTCYIIDLHRTGAVEIDCRHVYEV